MELFDLYTKDREKTGLTMVRHGEQPDGYYRLVVHICIFNSHGELLIQQRQPTKDCWADLWDITVGGCAVAGEDSRGAIRREVSEEIGLDMSFDGIRPALSISFDGGFDDVYIIKRDVDIDSLTLQPDEVKAVRWAGLDEILSMISSGAFIPYHKSYIELLFTLNKLGGTITGEDKTRRRADSLNRD